jgi:hypothetical protein
MYGRTLRITVTYNGFGVARVKEHDVKPTISRPRKVIQARAGLYNRRQGANAAAVARRLCTRAALIILGLTQITTSDSV